VVVIPGKDTTMNSRSLYDRVRDLEADVAEHQDKLQELSKLKDRLEQLRRKANDGLCHGQVEHTDGMRSECKAQGVVQAEFGCAASSRIVFLCMSHLVDLISGQLVCGQCHTLRNWLIHPNYGPWVDVQVPLGHAQQVVLGYKLEGVTCEPAPACGGTPEVAVEA
jgi:hypothetical protein